MSARTRRRSRMSIRYFDDSILLTETHAWAYYRLPTHAYEFTTPAEREALAINITVAMAAIRLPEAEVHLRVPLGQRGMRAQLSGGMFSQFINAYRASEQALGLHDEAVSASEIAKWT